MSETTIRLLSEEAETETVVEMMRALYLEDVPSSTVNFDRFHVTVETLLADKQRGCVAILEREAEICGYALLIPYWSNEFGGTLVYIDELYIRPEARGAGRGKTFLEWVATERPYDAVAALLEVSASNSRARKLYESSGFKVRSLTTMSRRLVG